MNEDLYVDLDDDTGFWCVFGENSGHAYSSWTSEADAQDDLEARMDDDSGEDEADFDTYASEYD
jgi:hypothetical protein